MAKHEFEYVLNLTTFDQVELLLKDPIHLKILLELSNQGVSTRNIYHMTGIEPAELEKHFAVLHEAQLLVLRNPEKKRYRSVAHYIGFDFDHLPITDPSVQLLARELEMFEILEKECLERFKALWAGSKNALLFEKKKAIQEAIQKLTRLPEIECFYWALKYYANPDPEFDTYEISILVEDLWPQMLKDDRVKKVAERILQPLPNQLELDSYELFLEVMDHVINGKKLSFPVDADIRRTEAIITRCRVNEVDGGIGFQVEYEYSTELHGKVVGTKTIGYDKSGMARSGWGTAKLKSFWSMGSPLICHYFRSEPKKHKIYSPFQK